MGEDDDRKLIIYKDRQDQTWGYTVALPGRKKFIPEEVLKALAFGDNPALTQTIAFQRLQENVRAELSALAETAPWDKNKAARHISQILQDLAQVHAYGYELGASYQRHT